MGQTLVMVSLPVFHPWEAPFPGVELVLGSRNSAGESSDSALEMRELGRDCARQAVHNLLGDTTGELIYSELGAPRWASGETEAYISISHTGQCAIGVAAGASIGVDIEFLDRDVSRLVRSFTLGEQELAKVVSPIALLCAKEAVGKAAGVGLAGSITRWSVIAFAVDTQSLVVQDLQAGDQWRVWIGVVDAGGRPLQCALAQPADSVREKLHEIYESAHVEMRPFGSQVWQECVEAVRERALGGVMITAWNPGPDRPSITENEKANGLLLTRLREYCTDIWEADGFSPNEVHREPGFIAWGMQSEIGLIIAREFSQFAIFYFKANGNRVLMSA